MPQQEKLTFSTAMAELEEIRNLLNDDLRDMDILLEKSKRAKELLDFCQKTLKQGEVEIKQIFGEEND